MEIKHTTQKTPVFVLLATACKHESTPKQSESMSIKDAETHAVLATHLKLLQPFLRQTFTTQQKKTEVMTHLKNS